MVSISSSLIRVHLNIEANVGRGQPNRQDDVQLVQFGYWCYVHDPKGMMTPQGRAIFSAVIPGAQYSGQPNDPLSLAIVAHQQYKGGTQDGFVSVLPKGHTQYGRDKNYRMLAYLMVSIYEVTQEYYPRIDHHAKCPKPLADRIKYITSL